MTSYGQFSAYGDEPGVPAMPPAGEPASDYAMMPAPCNDKDKVREMLEALGHKIDGEPGSPAENLSIMKAYMTEAMAASVDPNMATPKQSCDVILNAFNKLGWWDKQSESMKIAVGVGGVAVVGLAVYYFALRK